MTLQISDRVWDTTTTTGNGTITLANSPPNAYQAFGSVCSNNDTIYYAISNRNANEWETGLGTFHTSGPTLARTTVLASSNSNSAVSFSAGTKDVMGVWPAGVQLQGALNVKGFGAKGDGSTDDTTAIQNAINSLPASGGTIFFPSGNYLISSTLTIGNGTSSAASTTQGVQLVGFGISNFSTFNGLSEPSATKLTASAAFNTTTPMISINGPLQGWGVQNLIFDGGSNNAIGLKVISGAFGDCRNLSFINCFGGLLSTAVASIPGALTNADSLHNAYYGLYFNIPSGVNSYGIKLTGNSATNTDFNSFNNIWIAYASTGTPIGVWFQVCDSNSFFQLNFNGGSGSASATNVAYDYSVSNNFPAGNTIYAIDATGPGTSFANIGSAGGVAPNLVYGLTEANQAKIPSLVNLLMGGPLVYRAPIETSVTPAAASTGNTFAELWNSAKFVIRVSYYIVTTQTGSAGTMNLKFHWNDGSAAQSFTTATVDLTSLGSMTSGTVVLYTGDASTKPNYDIAFSGATGSPQVTFIVVPERVMEY